MEDGEALEDGEDGEALEVAEIYRWQKLQLKHKAEGEALEVAEIYRWQKLQLKHKEVEALEVADGDCHQSSIQLQQI